jgi:uncharacterized protein (DUF952 family)
MYEPVSIVQPSSAARNALRSADDRRDGFIHLSGTDQVVETAWRHFAGQTGLVLLAVDPARLREDLRWEPSRGGAFFPHVYGPLPAYAVVAVYAVPDDGPSRRRWPRF